MEIKTQLLDIDTNIHKAFRTGPMPLPELMLADNLSQVLDDELSRAQGLLGADAPALALGAEALQALHPLVPLDVLVVTLVHAGTGAGGALRKTHPNGLEGRVYVMWTNSVTQYHSTKSNGL